MTRPKKHPDAGPPFELVELVAQKMREQRPRHPSQHVMAEALGVSQPEVSRWLGLTKPKPKPYAPGDDITRHLAKRLGISDTYNVNGRPRAGNWEAIDMLPQRGRALDFLSGQFDRPLLEALKRYQAPAGNEKWTTDRWVVHLVTLKNAHDSGAIDLHAALPK
jgi:hypothetical protein